MSFWRGFTRPARYAALVAGALPVLAFPAPNLELVAWVGLVPGLLVLRHAPTGREAAVRGWWLGAGYLLFALYWLIPNVGPGLLLIAIVMGAPWAAFGYAAWRLLAPPGPTIGRALTAVVVLPAIWVTIEWIRSWQALGGPWAVLGATQWRHPVVLALAAVGGIWLISFVLVAANAAIAVALTAVGTARLAGTAGQARLAGTVGTALVGAALAVAAGPVAFALTAAEAAAPATGHVRLALVQPGIVTDLNRRIAEEIRLTSQARGADLVVWGESSVTYDLRYDPALLRRLRTLSARAQLLVNQDSIGPFGHTKDAILIGPDGIEGRYVKTRLVPFGEYIPFRPVLGWLADISRAAPVNMVPGTGAHVLHAVLPDGRRLTFGVLICFESTFPDMSRADTRQGAQVIIYQTSDTTFQQSWAPEQHASLGALRAAETGRPVVQAALTGDSAAFDSRGRVLAWMGTSDRGVLAVRLALPPRSVLTPFDRFGDYVPWLSVAVTAIALLSWANLAGVFRRFRRA
ncbi:MAG: apolipoprotein N-acyltransferase [Streptosporangiaceae bacterium]